MEPDRPRFLLALVLLLASSLRLAVLLAGPEVDLLGDPVRLPSWLPDLRHDGRAALAVLPGLGGERAARVVAGRPFLGVPLKPDNLHRIAGVGETTRDEVLAWYRQRGSGGPAP